MQCATPLCSRTTTPPATPPRGCAFRTKSITHCRLSMAGGPVAASDCTEHLAGRDVEGAQPRGFRGAAIHIERRRMRPRTRMAARRGRRPKPPLQRCCGRSEASRVLGRLHAGNSTRTSPIRKSNLGPEHQPPPLTWDSHAMTFRGLFIGIDRYASPLVSDLTCSARDARALHALFADSIGLDHCSLFTDSQATRQTILHGLEQLTTADTHDLVFIHFSGHGSDTHHLVTHDAEPSRLDTTAIQLEELVVRFAAIPAKNLILCLDCCFSGAAGAKVLHSPVAPRATVSAADVLGRIGGTGRIILTASGAKQAAIEDRRKGHGLFSYYLIRALMGAPGVLDAGAISLLGLANFVTKSVEEAATQFRHIQQPALRGTLDGAVRLPLLTRGHMFGRLFPSSSSTSITADPQSLTAHGFSTDIINALEAHIPSLNQLQQKAVNEMGLFAGANVVVSAPTSSGKTLIGELSMLRVHMGGERSFMLLPLRALVNDKYEDLRRKYSSLGLRVIRSTGEISDDNGALMRGKFDMALLTYERFTSLALTAPFLLRNVGLIVVDELQMLTDAGRGANLEFLLTHLKAQRTIGIEPQLVTLSAVVGDTNGFERWLGARLLYSTERPVPIEEGTISLDGDFRFVGTDGKEQRRARYVTPEYRKGSSQDVIIPLVRQLVEAGEKILVFRETKPIVRATARYLARGLGLAPAAAVLGELPAGDPSAASATLREALRGGVAFHNADLDRDEREAVERSFRDPDGQVKVLVATTTLAMGVNTPAWSVVIEGLTHPGGTPYSVAEYKNMIGRAGRLGWTPTGKAFLVAPRDELRLWAAYVRGQPEPLRSRFGEQDLLTAVCRVLGTADSGRVAGLGEEDIVAFLRSTFAAFQSGRSWSSGDIRAAIQRLAQADLVKAGEGRYRLTSLGEVAGHLGIAVESVVRVAAALRGVPLARVGAATLVAAAQVTEELDGIFLPVHRRSVQERARWRAVPGQQGLPDSVTRAIWSGSDATVTARCKRLAAGLMWTQGVELDQLEQSLLRHLPESNAAGAIRSVAERTRDVVGVVSRVAEIINPGKMEEVEHLGELVDAMTIQLELGIPAEMVWLGKRLRRELTRGEYLALFRAGLSGASEVMEWRVEVAERLFPIRRRRDLVVAAAAEEMKLKSAGEEKLAMPVPSDG